MQGGSINFDALEFDAFERSESVGSSQTHAGEWSECRELQGAQHARGAPPGPTAYPLVCAKSASCRMLCTLA